MLCILVYAICVNFYLCLARHHNNAKLATLLADPFFFVQTQQRFVASCKTQLNINPEGFKNIITEVKTLKQSGQLEASAAPM